jgi:hypothetical protein
VHLSKDIAKPSFALDTDVGLIRKYQRGVISTYRTFVWRYIWDKFICCLRFEVFTPVIMKNGVFGDVTPCGFCKNRRFGGT